MFRQPRRFGWYVVLAFAAFFLVKDPIAAARLTHEAAVWVVKAANASARYLSAF